MNFYIFQNLFCLIYKFLALIYNINLDIVNFTVLKCFESNYLEILPIPAPQSNTESQVNVGNLLATRFKNQEE